MKSINYVPAGVGERMQYLTHKYNDTTIRFLLRYPGHPNPELLCAATEAVIRSVDILHASYVPKSRGSHWRVSEKFDCADYFALAHCDGNPMKPAQCIALQPIFHNSPCQMHVTLVQGDDCSAVVVRISHLVVDGSDGKYLLNKLAESYQLLRETGTADNLFVKDGNRSATNAYQDLTGKELLSLVKPPFHGVKTNYPFSNDQAHGPLRMLRRTIPAETLGKARARAKEQNATINDLLLTACYRAYAMQMKHTGPMSVSAMMDLRHHCKDGTSEGLSNMSGGLSTSLDIDPARPFAADLQIIATQTRAAKADPLSGLDGMPVLHAATKIFPLWLLLQAADFAYSALSLSLTNLGNISCDTLRLDDMKPVEGVFGGPLKRKPSVQVGAASFDGTAELTILGDFTAEDLPSVQMFLDAMAAEVATYAEETEGCT